MHKQYIYNFFAANLYFSILLLCTVFVFSKDFEYAGIVIDIQYPVILIFINCLFQLSFCTSDRNVNFLMALYYSVHLCPLLLLDGGRLGWPIIANLIFIFLFVLATQIHKKRISIPLPSMRRRSLIMLTTLLLSAYAFLLISHGTPNLNITEVYIHRATNDDYGILDLIANLASKVILPVALALGLFYRNMIIVTIVVAIYLLLFGHYHHRTNLFLPIALIGIWILFAFERYMLLVYFMVLSLILILLASFSAFSDTIFYMSSLIVRRGFFVPALLSNEAFEYFGSHGFYMWNQITGLTDYKYSVSTLIAQSRGGVSGGNVGLVAAGFAQLGFVGLLVYTIIFIFFFRFLASNNSSRLIGVGCFPVFQAILFNSDLVTSLGSHGGLLLLVVVALILRKIDQHQNRQIDWNYRNAS